MKPCSSEFHLMAILSYHSGDCYRNSQAQTYFLKLMGRNSLLNASSIAYISDITFAFRSASNDSKIISDNRLLEWIQQNRPQASNRRNNLASISEKLPYYGRYCGSFSEQVSSDKIIHTVVGSCVNGTQYDWYKLFSIRLVQMTEG